MLGASRLVGRSLGRAALLAQFGTQRVKPRILTQCLAVRQIWLREGNLLHGRELPLVSSLGTDIGFPKP
jgi:hypothetical protein